MIRWALLALGGARTACAQGVISFAEAISIFHVNEYSAGPVPINMNSANLLGDMYFEIRGRVEPLECADETQQTGTRTRWKLERIILRLRREASLYGANRAREVSVLSLGRLKPRERARSPSFGATL